MQHNKNLYAGANKTWDDFKWNKMLSYNKIYKVRESS